MRLPHTKLAENAEEIFQTYFVDQTHHSIVHHVQNLPVDVNHLVQVTTHSRLLTSVSQTELADALGLKKSAVILLSIQQFMSEAEFEKKLESYFQVGRSLDNASVTRLHTKN